MQFRPKQWRRSLVTGSPGTLQSLLWLPRVVLFAVDIGMVFQGLQVSSDFGRHPKFGRQAFFQNRRETVSLAHRCESRKQQVHFDDLPISGGSEPHAMVLNS
jgi:hypothetical protein